MGRLVLVTGGCRSGKSGYAQGRVEALPGARLYVATAEIYGEEMRARVERHRRDREGRGWDTVEAPFGLAETLRDAKNYSAILVDCLTLWTSNRFFGGVSGEIKETAGEDEASAAARELVDAARGLDATVVFVTNEVGWGVVPDNAMARRFRDLAGRVNQAVASAADEVVLMACGLPLVLKG